MRTGANFARGSCRALKWMLVLGALSVLGSAQATAQPTVELKAKYDSATSRSVMVTMSEEVPVDLAVGENAQNLSADFALVGGNTGVTAIDGTPVPATAPGHVKPIAVDGIPSDRYPGRTTFTLRFSQAIGDLTEATTAVTEPAQLRLIVYTPAATRPIKATDDDAAFAEVTAADPLTPAQVPVIGPEQTSVLTLAFETGQKKTELQEVQDAGDGAGDGWPRVCRRPPARSARLSPTPSSTCPLGWSSSTGDYSPPPLLRLPLLPPPNAPAGRSRRDAAGQHRDVGHGLQRHGRRRYRETR